MLEVGCVKRKSERERCRGVEKRIETEMQKQKYKRETHDRYTKGRGREEMERHRDTKQVERHPEKNRDREAENTREWKHNLLQDNF